MAAKAKSVQYNILGLIENANKPYYEMIKRLCIGHLFVPKAGTEVTFLIPDDKLTEVLQKMESNNETIEECIRTIQACVLVGYYTDPEDFRNGALSVVQAKVAPIPAKNLSPMKDFLPKEYKNSVSVLQISGQLPSPPTTLAPEEDKDKLIKRKKRYDNSDDIHRAFFTTAARAKTKYDQAYVNLLMAIYNASEDDGKTIIQSQLSYDTFATFYILLKPNISDVKDHPYKCLFEPLSKLQPNINSIASQPSQKDAYVQLMNSYESKVGRNNAPIHTSIAPAIVYNTLGSYYTDIKKRNPQHPRIEFSTSEIMCAEDEFRMISFWAISNDDELTNAQLGHYTLDKPKVCSTNVAQNMPVYYSIAHALARSDALFYEPNRLKDVAKDFKFFNNSSIFLSLQKTETLIEYFKNNN